MSTVAASQVAEFVRALALGWKNLAAYPPGHPALIGSLELIRRRLDELRGPGGEIALGIARDGVLYGQEKIDSIYAQKFGNALYTRGVAILRFDTATTAADIEAFLRLLGGGPASDSKRPIWEELTAAGIISIHLQPVDYSEVQVSDVLEEGASSLDSESLWDEILRAITAGRELSAEGNRLLAQKVRSASELATLIMQYVNTLEHPAEFDPDSTFGVRFSAPGGEVTSEVARRMADSIGGFIGGKSGAKRDSAVRQAVELLKTLPDSMRALVMRAVMRALATEESSGALLNDFTSSLPRDQVLETLRYLSSITTLSTHAVRLVESLMALPKAVQESAAPTDTMLSELVQLFGEDDVDRFNPDDHRQLLDDVNVQIPRTEAVSSPTESLGPRLQTITSQSVNHQLADTVINLLLAHGPSRPPVVLLDRVEPVFKSEVSAGDFGEALDLARQLQEIAIRTSNSELQNAIHDFFGRLGSPETIRSLIDRMQSSPPEKLPAIKQLLEILGSAATKNLLLALAEENNRSRRRRLFDFVASLGTTIVPEIKVFLGDSRWYVVRNMIVLLRTVNDRSLLGDIRRCANHPDLRVRMEAIKALLALEPAPPHDLLAQAIRDPDPKAAEKAITLVGSYGIKEAVDPLLQVVSGNDLFGSRRPLRIQAIKVLGELAEPRALPRLQRFFKDSIFPWPAKEERRAAYESLAGYPDEARAPIVEKGLHSRDPHVREICRKIAGH